MVYQTGTLSLYFFYQKDIIDVSIIFLIWLVVWNIFFPYIGNNNPNWLYIFQMGWNHQPVTDNQLWVTIT